MANLNGGKMKKFYRAELEVCEGGVCVYFKGYISFYETNCYHYCVSGGDGYSQLLINGLAGIDALRKLNGTHKASPVTKIDKRGSRIAFATKEKAIEQLKRRKKRRAGFIRSELEMIDKFLSSNLVYAGGGDLIAEASQEFVHDIYVVD